jgi:hypothetical protein
MLQKLKEYFSLSLTSRCIPFFLSISYAFHKQQLHATCPRVSVKSLTTIFLIANPPATAMSELDAEYPTKADLRKDVSKPLPMIAPGTVDPDSMVGDAAATQAMTVLNAFNAAVASNDAEKLASCFYDEQAY